MSVPIAGGQTVAVEGEGWHSRGRREGGGTGLARVGGKAFGESVPQRLDRLVAEGRMGPVVAAFPDCFTSLGGNQYIDSAATGRWEAFLIGEMLPRLEQEVRLLAGREHRAVFGKSSGGSGAPAPGRPRAG